MILVRKIFKDFKTTVMKPYPLLSGKKTGLNLSILSFFIFCMLSFSVQAADVTISTVRTFSGPGGLDQSDGTTDGIFTVNGNFTVTGTGVINEPANPIRIHVTGNVLLQNGSLINSSSLGGCFGSDKGPGGDIEIIATGNIIAETGSSILANGCSGGHILIQATGNASIIDIDGEVRSQGFSSGTGSTQRPGGGFIEIITRCTLTISNTGNVISQGQDPGADLVHLEACTVFIYGKVQSIGVGHAVPNSPKTHLVPPYRPDKTCNATTGVEVWADNITIDNTNGHNGEINADHLTGGGLPGWIDIFARNNINIIADPSGTFAVHGNNNGNDLGAYITVKSIEGNITASGVALQSDATLGGGNGGTIIIEAKNNVVLNNAIIYARGDFASSGGFGTGGKVKIRSYNTSITWATGVGDVQPTGTDVTPASRGTITFTKCTPGAVNTAGTTFPFSNNGVGPAPVATPPVTNADVCGGNPLLPCEEPPPTYTGCPVVLACTPYVNLPVCQGGGGTPGACRTCDGEEVIVNQNVTLNFNTAIPTCSGDPDLCALFTWDKSGGVTADKWRAIFNLGSKKLIVQNGATISVSSVNGYAPGIDIYTTCDVQVDNGGHIVVNSFNKNAGNININAGGHITVNGEIRNEVSGTLGLPGAITAVSKCGDIFIGNLGIVQILGVDPGGNTITLLTCGQGTNEQTPPCGGGISLPLVQGGNITINGLVKSFAHAHSGDLTLNRPNIRVVSVNGTVTVNSNANGGEPQYDEFQTGGGRYDLFGGLLTWVSANVNPGSIWVQAKGDITVYGHGNDPTGTVRKSFGAMASIATASSAPGGLVDVRSLDGNIIGTDRAFDVSGRNRLTTKFARINLYAKGNILLSRPGANASFNPVVDASGTGAGDFGGINDLRSYSGGISVTANALVTAAVTGGTNGVNNFTTCTGITINTGGAVTPAPVVAVNCVPPNPAPSSDAKFEYGYLLSLCGGIARGTEQVNPLTNLETVKTTRINSYPNPFTQSTTIRLSLAKAENVSLKIYTVDGQEVGSLMNGGHLDAGEYSMQWDASKQPGGIYFARIKAGNFISTIKLVVMK